MWTIIETSSIIQVTTALSHSELLMLIFDNEVALQNAKQG